ncbi:MAG: TraK family protein [Desulfovibrio sp.]|nr:TraK family protein [Desulfovibrio sp.]
MSAGKKRIPRNMSRIEFLACRELIESLLAQGLDKKKVHTRLVEGGQVTMSYDAFCRVLTRAVKNKLNIQSLAPPVQRERAYRLFPYGGHGRAGHRRHRCWSAFSGCGLSRIPYRGLAQSLFRRHQHRRQAF